MCYTTPYSIGNIDMVAAKMILKNIIAKKIRKANVVVNTLH